MHSAVQTAAVTIISYKPLSDLNFARYTQHYGSCMPSSPLGFISPWHYFYTPSPCIIYTVESYSSLRVFLISLTILSALLECILTSRILSVKFPYKCIKVCKVMVDNQCTIGQVVQYSQGFILYTLYVCTHTCTKLLL